MSLTRICSRRQGMSNTCGNDLESSLASRHCLARSRSACKLCLASWRRRIHGLVRSRSRQATAKRSKQATALTAKRISECSGVGTDLHLERLQLLRVMLHQLQQEQARRWHQQSELLLWRPWRHHPLQTEPIQKRRAPLSARR